VSDPETTWLRDVEELRQLPQRYARAVDQRDIGALAELFDPAGSVDGAQGLLHVTDYLKRMRSAPRAFATSMHMLGEPLIVLEPGADSATTDTYAVVYQFREPGQEGANLEIGIRYVDDVRRLDARWVIRHRVATTIWRRDVAR
jgi:hypothetical protein